MSYAVSAALQKAVYARLLADAGVQAAVGDAVYDALPEGLRPATFVSLGPERVRDRSDKSGAGALHDFTVSVVTREAGFAGAKAAAGAVSDALAGAALSLERGALVGLWFLRAKADRKGAERRIDLSFRARTTDG